MKKISGTHLIVDAYVNDVQVLQKDYMFRLFDELVEQLGMCYLQRPQAVEVPLDPQRLSTDEDDGGCSYYCMITTSHISAHTWDLRKAIMLDVFSCRPFDAKLAEQLLRERLGFKSSRIRVVDRDDPELDDGTANP
jgi:S-adenosylmethionine decarboxylase